MEVNFINLKGGILLVVKSFVRAKNGKGGLRSVDEMSFFNQCWKQEQEKSKKEKWNIKNGMLIMMKE